jgi:hypothetical protein
MTTPTYTVPENPVDPEAAALELIVRMPEVVGVDAPSHLTELLQEFTMALDVGGAFTGLSWHDAKHAAAAMVADLIERDDPAAFLRFRATLAASGADNMTWDDRDAMVRALNVGAEVLGS